MEISEPENIKILNTNIQYKYKILSLEFTYGLVK